LYNEDPMRIALISLALSSVAFASAAPPEETYLGLYLQGQKIGYVASKVSPGKLDGLTIVRSDSKTVMDMGLLGTPLRMVIDSSTWSSKGRPVRMTFRQESSGRVSTMDARFVGDKVRILLVNSGQKSQKVLTVPKGPIVDDPLTLVQSSGIKGAQKFWVLDPTTSTFIQNSVRMIGPSIADVKGKKVAATLAEIVDPRAITKIYVDAKGGFVKAEAPMGIEMLPESKLVAMKTTPGYTPNVDIAAQTSLKPTPPIEAPGELTELKLRFTGPDLSRLPTDEHQTVAKEGNLWTVDVHPPKRTTGISIYASRQMKPDWAKPGMNIPSNDPRILKVAKTIVGDKKTVIEAADAVQVWVYAQMTPNAGIGVLRDATEVLKTKEGVCRDYAVLTAALLRAAGVPTRLASGLVTWDGTFYYHAWCEVWDGARWIGVDSTTTDRQLAANHVKLSDGDVETAFTFTFLDRAKVEVLGTRRD